MIGSPPSNGRGTTRVASISFHPAIAAAAVPLREARQLSAVVNRLLAEYLCVELPTVKPAPTIEVSGVENSETS